jgi:hypothetical protein
VSDRPDAREGEHVNEPLAMRSKTGVAPMNPGRGLRERVRATIESETAPGAVRRIV